MLRGDPVLHLPDAFPGDSLMHMRSLAQCMRGIMQFDNQTCAGYGRLAGIPADLMIERNPQGDILTATYDFKMAAFKQVRDALVLAFGAPRERRPELRGSGYLEMCWPLSVGQEVVLQPDFDRDDEFSVTIDSEAAASWNRKLLALQAPCVSQPEVPRSARVHSAPSS